MSQTFGVDVDALDLFDQVAAMARVDAGLVYRGFLRLWQFCWREKVDRVTRERLGAFFPVEDLAGFTRASISCEFLSDDQPDNPAGLLVRGAAKRLGIYKARSAAGRKASGNLVQFRQVTRDGPPGDPVGNPAGDSEQNTGSLPIHPITQSPSKDHDDLKQLSRVEEAQLAFAEGRGPPVSLAQLVPLPRIPDDRGASGADYFAWAQHERVAGGFVVEKPPPIAALGKWFSEILSEVNGDMDRVDATLAAFVHDPYWREKNCPFRAFMSEWRKFVPRKAVSR